MKIMSERELQNWILELQEERNKLQEENEKLLQEIDELKYDIEFLKDRIDYIEQDREDNYKPMSKEEQYDVHDNMFI